MRNLFSMNRLNWMLSCIILLISFLEMTNLSKTADEGSWRTKPFRQSIAKKIDEALQKSGVSTTLNSLEMECHVFEKAKTMEEYLAYTARLILHMRETSCDTVISD